MNIAVRYYTKSGNTLKLAKAAAEELDTRAADLSEDLTEKADVLFLGASLYKNTFDPQIAAFLERNEERIGVVVCFGSSASKRSCFPKLQMFLEERGIRSYDESFTCPGHFLFLHKDRPNEKDLEDLKAFVREARAKLGV